MNTAKKYKGIIVPAITPLTEKLQLDEKAVKKIFTLFYKHHISPFVLGTTGEAASLPLQLKKDYILAAEKNKKMGIEISSLIGGEQNKSIAKRLTKLITF